MIKAIFFDWFNTLARYDPPREESHSQILSTFGIDISPAQLMPALLVADKYFFNIGVGSQMVKRDRDALAKIYFRYAEIMLGEVGVKPGKDVVAQIIRKWPQIFTNSKFVLFDDVLPTLKILKERQLVLGLLTNATKDAISIHIELGLEPYLDHTVTSEEAGVDKPEPQIFLKALEKASAKASETLYVGDQPTQDVAGARGAGITPILIDRYNLYPEFGECSRICTLPELVSYI